MSKVIQIRNVPDNVHDLLVKAATSRGLSLTRYIQHELERLANQAQLVQENAEIIRRTQAAVQGQPDRETILSILHDERGD